MAITGTGTQGDPYIVHDYTELKTACKTYAAEGSTIYVKLGNDIDCNAYGESFEWETVTIGRDYNHVGVLDFDGHTVENIMIKTNNSLFKGYVGTILKNGNILNVFNNSGVHVFDADATGNGVYWTIQNISLSTNLSSMTGVAFSHTKFENSAVYFETPKLLNRIWEGYGYQSGFKNCDVEFKITERNGNIILFYDSSYNDSTFDNCRVVGELGGLGGGLNNDVFFRQGSKGFVNCVVDITAYGEAGYSFFNTGNTGVINKDHFGIGTSQEGSDHNYANAFGLTAVTSAEILNGDALRTAGFVVVNTV